MYVIYLYTDMRNGMQYVGKTNNLKRRDKDHKCRAGKTMFENIYSAHKEDFKLEIIRNFHDISDAELGEWEKYFIAKLNTKWPNGYNLTDGGEGTSGRECSLEARRKISESKKGKKINRKFSDEELIAISERHKGKKLSEETRQKISIARIGRFRGTDSPMAKATRCIELNMTFETAQFATDWLRENGWPKASHSAISRACRNPNHTAYGYHWEYINEEGGEKIGD